MQHQVDQAACIGCGACCAICPEGFKMNSHGKAEPCGHPDEAALRDACDSCPVGAISLK